METDTQQTKRLEKFIIIVGIFVVFDLIFWSVFTRFVAPYLYDLPFLYESISLVFAFAFCAIPVIGGILIRHQTWKILLIVLGAVAFVVRIILFSFHIFERLW
jgi:hypothetical protein